MSVAYFQLERLSAELVCVSAATTRSHRPRILHTLKVRETRELDMLPSPADGLFFASFTAKYAERELRNLCQMIHQDSTLC